MHYADLCCPLVRSVHKIPDMERLLREAHVLFAGIDCSFHSIATAAQCNYKCTFCLYDAGRNEIDGQVHFEGHLKEWTLKIETFVGPEMATIEASAIWTQKSRNFMAHSLQWLSQWFCVSQCAI
jgi:hypothetical protein